MPYFTPDLANPHSRGWSGGCHSPWRNSRSWLAIGVILLGILYDPKASALFGLTRSAGRGPPDTGSVFAPLGVVRWQGKMPPSGIMTASPNKSPLPRRTVCTAWYHLPCCFPP